jgi:hypothetical protein
MISKLTALILGFLILFVTPIVAFGQDDEDGVGATHLARVIVPRAIVYSDENMNSPLGYISNDRLITVGNPRKKNPDLLPLVVYGRLAFIETKSIHYENEKVEMQSSKRGAPKEHNIDIILTKPEEKLSENNSAYFDLHQFSGGDDTKNLLLAVDNKDSSSYLGYGLFLLHRKPHARIFWGAGYEYNFISSENVSVKAYMLRGILGYTPFRSALFLIDVDASLDFSVTTQLEVKNNYTTEPNGFIYGPTAHARIVFFPENKYHVFGTMGLRSYKVIRLENVTDANGNVLNGISKMSGLDIGIGLALEI